MKTDQLNLRTSIEDKRLLQRAAKKFEKETGVNGKVSKVILHSVSEYANKPAEMYFCDRISIRQTNDNIEYGRAKLQAVYDEFLEVTKTALTIEDLQTMFAGLGKLGSESIIQSAIRELVTKKSYDKLKADHPDFIFSIENVPDKDLSNLFKLADELGNIPEVKMHYVGVYWHCYEISKESKIIVIPDQAERMSDSFRFFASTPAELQKLAKVKSLCESLNSILKDPEVLPGAIFSLVFFDQESKQFSPSGSYIKYNTNFFNH